MQRLKDTIVNQYITTKFYFILSAFMISISVLAIYSSIMVSHYNSNKDDVQAESIRHLLNSTDWWINYQAHVVKENIYQLQVDNLNIALSDKNQEQQQSRDMLNKNLTDYTALIGELDADKDIEDSLNDLKFKAEDAYKSYVNSIKEINTNTSLIKVYDFVIILLIIGASLGGMSETAKYKPLGYSAFSFGGLGVVILLLTMFMPQVTMFLPQVLLF
jgi:Domain of unknown function (DUF4337)